MSKRKLDRRAALNWPFIEVTVSSPMVYAFRDIDGAGSGFAAVPAAPSHLDVTVARAAEALATRQKADGHFLFDLEADAAIPAEYVLVKRFLGEPDLDMEAKTAVYLRRRQEADGGWPMLARGPANISASVRAYLVLRIAGDEPDPRTCSAPARRSCDSAAPST